MPFFKPTGPYKLAELAELVGAEIVRGDGAAIIEDVASIDEAGPGEISFFSNKAYADQLGGTRAGAVLTKPAFVDMVGEGSAVLVCKDPAGAHEALVRHFYPQAARPLAIRPDVEGGNAGTLAPGARIEDGAIIEPGAHVGPGAQIGRGTRIMAGAVIGPHVCIGRDCSIGPGVTVLHAFVGDRVILHPGVRIGQDGFGYSPGPRGLRKAHQVGKVVIQDDVEIGANSCIDRGAIRDTIIGEGSKIDNLVQIGHNCVVGRHCVIVGFVALAGSVTIGDGVMIGGHAVVNNHVRVASGVRIMALSAVQNDLEEPGDYGGAPARPARQWLREHLMSIRMARERIESEKKGGGSTSRETKK